MAPTGLRHEVYRRSRGILRHHGAGLAGVGTALELQPDRMGLYGTAALRGRFGSLPGTSRRALARRLGVAAIEGYGEPDLVGARPVAVLRPGISIPRPWIAALDGALPPARIVGAALGVRDDQQAYEAMISGSVAPEDTVILSGIGEGLVGTPGSAGSARLARHGLSELSVSVDADRHGWLVLTENADEGWRAWLDGAPTPVLRGDLVLRVVELPPGRHEVVLRYRSPGWTAGLLAALTGTLVLIALVLWERARPV